MLSNILDWLYEYMLISGIVSLAILMYFGFFQITKLFQKKSKFRFIALVLLFTPFIVLWSFIFSGSYGFAHSPKEMVVSKNSLCFLDTYIRRNRSGEHQDIRMYILDATTGQRKFRYFLGYECHLLASEDGMILYSNADDYCVLDPETNTIQKTFSASTIPTMFPQASAGVGEISFDGEDEGNGTMLLKVLCKNGNTYYIDPFSGKIAEATFPAQSKSIGNNDFFGAVTVKATATDSAKKIEFNTKQGSVASKLGYYGNGKMNYDSEDKSFLYPDFIAAFGKEGIVVIRSYETTDKTNFILTGVSLDMKKLWQINRKDLGGAGFDFKHCSKYEDNFIFNLDNVFYSINAKTGKVNWKSAQ